MAGKGDMAVSLQTWSAIPIHCRFAVDSIVTDEHVRTRFGFSQSMAELDRDGRQRRYGGIFANLVGHPYPLLDFQAASAAILSRL